MTDYERFPFDVVTHGNEAVSQLLTQFGTATVLQGLLRTYATQWDELDVAFEALLVGRLTLGAQGTNLDNLAAVVGIARQALTETDPHFEGRVLTWLACLVSHGTFSEVRTLADTYSTLAGGSGVVMVEGTIAEFEVTASGTLDAGEAVELDRFVQAAKAAGVKANTSASEVEEYFGFDEDTDPDALGFDDGGFAVTLGDDSP